MFLATDLLKQSCVWLFQCFPLFAGKFYFKITNEDFTVSLKEYGSTIDKSVFYCLTIHTELEVSLFGMWNRWCDGRQ